MPLTEDPGRRRRFAGYRFARPRRVWANDGFPQLARSASPHLDRYHRGTRIA
jgi:hypothetical protein